MKVSSALEANRLLVLTAAIVFSYGKTIKKEESCKEPIGIQTGFLETRDIKTSTAPKNFSATDAWCPTTSDEKQFFAVDLGEDFSIFKVATQGKVDDLNRFVKSYQLEYSSDASKWTPYIDILGNGMLEGNKNTFAVQSHDLAPAVIARYFKLLPKEWNNGICTRLELYGCAVEDLKKSKAKS